MERLPLASWPRRLPDSHKGDYGTVLIIAGCRSYPGAAILAALGAGRLGAGLVRLSLPRGIVPEVLAAAPFATVLRCAESAGGGLSAEASREIVAASEDADAVVMGPGLGTEDGTGRLLESLLPALDAPLVLDADGLNLLATAPERLLAGRAGPTVLTPHPGEFARLTTAALPVGDDERSREAASLARKLGVVVVLKGHHTVVTDGRRLHRETAGNPGMATGGMGDVLAGALGAVLARLADSRAADLARAAALAVQIHARAGDLAAAELSEDGLLPEDVAERLGRAAEAR